jgi:DNA mismatch endonuclease (patch repair protein)
MADDRTQTQRSETMRRVRSKDTSCELLLRRELHRRGLRYRLHTDLPGKPDIVFVSARLAVFVDGCFWHGCPEHCRIPTTNRRYWEAKIARNQKRDATADAALRADGWRVVRVWEHRVRDKASRAKIVARIVRLVRADA